MESSKPRGSACAAAFAAEQRHRHTGGRVEDELALLILAQQRDGAAVADAAVGDHAALALGALQNVDRKCSA